MRPKDIHEAKRIRDALKAFSIEHVELPGINSPHCLSALVEQIIESIRRVRFLEHLATRSNDPCCRVPDSNAFDPFKAAVEAKRGGDLDESCWLVFLATHFGKTRKNGWSVVARVYGALTGTGYWTWSRVSNSTDEFEEWFATNASNIQPSSGSAFGNHRKYESLRSDSRRSVSKVVRSYVNFIQGCGGHVRLLEDAICKAGGDYGDTFEVLYNNFGKIFSFGRTAKFDLLSTHSKLRILPITPVHPYLAGATGPLRGAKLLICGDASVRCLTQSLSSTIVKLGLITGLRMDVLEDALCNWQKSPFKFVPFRG